MKAFIGGKEVISRILNCYGFANRKLLSEHLGIPHSTFGTWAKRDYFPAELVIHCALETGARLEYVAYGIEPIFDDSMNMKYFQSFNLESGKLFINENKAFLLPLLPNLDSRASYNHIFCVSENKRTFFINPNYDTLTDGDYFVLVENSHLIRYLTVLPGGKVRVDGGKFSFECDLVDIEIKGKVILKMEKC
ncbi:helix-turn-helix domain-containing protein [Pasteurella multocida]|uniref:CI n=1 Tax=Pasteurella phage F108 TaxID=2911430 RepID=Q1I117_9CAUD|nr:phage repressor protein CI [Pasteurella multocida]YP_654714.1 repressor protein CI [Pasteurella phage F108]AAZ93641.1 CI [Pasteurella phage F108]MBE7394392.1 phage repressor protein CI [Pasteurella multocida]MBF6983259.1 phage repressor protein CI [Pasteurella multocida]MCL7761442.1 helix-turn-helix domain-containing protein [Pasteurella multocida]MCL7768396.1 helix-turn-helix domain-containing protein [Pasteurella multocida]